MSINQKVCWGSRFVVLTDLGLEDFVLKEQDIAWENSRNLVSLRNALWETSAEIPYWWRVTTQIWVMPLIGWSKFSTWHDQSEALPTMEVKSVGTFPVILLKLVTPPLPPQTKLNLAQNGWKWVLFLATSLLGEVEGRRYKPKAEQKIVRRSRVLRNNCLKGLFTQSQVLLSSIVDLGSDASSVWNFCASVITRRNQWWRREMSAFSG